MKLLRSGVRTMAVVGALLGLSAYQEAAAQPEAPLILPELPFTSSQGIGTRAAGMGFAHTAVVEDGSALAYNPAGLAQIRRLEFGAGLIHNRQNRTVGFNSPALGRSESDADVTASQLSHLSIAYPYPTYRGALVMAFAFQRQNSLKSDYFRQGILLEQEGGRPGLVEQESFSEDGSVNFWTAGIAGDFSSRISIGASLSYIQGRTEQTFDVGRFRQRGAVLDVEGSDEVFQSIEDRAADLNGYTGSLGILGRVSDLVRIGVNIDLPRRFEFEGTNSSLFEDQEKIDRARTTFTDVITLPLSATGGVAITPPNLLLAADIRLTDWTQIEFEGPVRARDREFAYRSTADIHLGAEYQIPSTPTRLRVGFGWEPLPYRLMPGAITFTFVPDDNNAGTTDDASFFTRDYPEARFTSDRRFLTFGVGTLIDDALMLDVAWVHGSYERTAAGFSEDWSNDRILASTTFRF